MVLVLCLSNQHFIFEALHGMRLWNIAMWTWSLSLGCCHGEQSYSVSWPVGSAVLSNSDQYPLPANGLHSFSCPRSLIPVSATWIWRTMQSWHRILARSILECIMARLPRQGPNIAPFSGSFRLLFEQRQSLTVGINKIFNGTNGSAFVVKLCLITKRLPKQM